MCSLFMVMTSKAETMCQMQDLNPRTPACKSGPLPTEVSSPKVLPVTAPLLLITCMSKVYQFLVFPRKHQFTSSPLKWTKEEKVWMTRIMCWLIRCSVNSAYQADNPPITTECDRATITAHNLPVTPRGTTSKPRQIAHMQQTKEKLSNQIYFLEK